MSGFLNSPRLGLLQLVDGVFHLYQRHKKPKGVSSSIAGVSVKKDSLASVPADASQQPTKEGHREELGIG